MTEEVAHRANNALQVIFSFTDLLAVNADEDAREMLAHIRWAAGQLRDVLSDLRLQMERGNFPGRDELEH